MSGFYCCPKCGDRFLFQPDPCPTCASRRRQKQRAARSKEKRGSYDLTGQVAAGEFWQLLRWYPCCPCCGKPWAQTGSPGGVVQRTIAQDHIIPLSRGGPNTTANLQPLCQSCNLWKSDHLICFDAAVPGQAKALPQRLWPHVQQWSTLQQPQPDSPQQLDWLDIRDPLNTDPPILQHLVYPLASPAQLQVETLRLTQAAMKASINWGSLPLTEEEREDR
ncbi:HNH endonuclease [Synechococcus sp. Nb3U1]|uniref:HNH endonuclease n=1 Tax=Synechococcus sp. Nb3U1 TaxID=1914529 RepID=UPI001F284597|nr:HNH endonuclease signature motif containing protein [Synechococcus sp. Nb3U1]MCF2971849.1 HNH endonuclease [Synechococcus sp. Nb3U1]